MNGAVSGITAATLGAAALAARSRTLLLLLLAAAAPLACGQSGPGPGGEQSLRAFYRDISQYHGSFEQAIFDENLQQVEESAGLVWFARPGRFRWDYSQPVWQLIVSDGDKLWVYDRDLEQVTVRGARAALAHTPAALLASDDDLDAGYRVRDLGRQGALAWVELSPRGAEGEGGADYHQLRFGFEQGELRVLELVDGLEQTTRVTFTRRAAPRPGSRIVHLQAAARRRRAGRHPALSRIRHVHIRARHARAVRDRGRGRD